MVPSEACAVLGLASEGLVCTKKIKEVGMSSVAYLRQMVQFICDASSSEGREASAEKLTARSLTSAYQPTACFSHMAVQTTFVSEASQPQIVVFYQNKCVSYSKVQYYYYY